MVMKMSLLFVQCYHMAHSYSNNHMDHFSGYLHGGFARFEA